MKLLALALPALLLISGCSSFTHGLRPEDASTVAVAFDPHALGDLAAQMKTLQVRVFQVIGDARGAQDGQDQRIPVDTTKKEYVLSGIGIGMKEIEISILDPHDQALGTGAIRVAVKPGLNKTDPLIIKIAPVPSPLVSMTVQLALSSTPAGTDPYSVVKQATLAWKTQNAGTSGTLTLTGGAAGGTPALAFTDVKSIIDTSCTSCHKGATASKKLHLDAFPFTDANYADQPTIDGKVMARLLNADNPMPPDGQLPADQLDKLKLWQAGGFLATAPAAGSPGLSGTLKDLKVADKLLCTLTLTGDGGVVLYTKVIDPYEVESNDTLKLSAALDLANAQVTIPIVVEHQ